MCSVLHTEVATKWWPHCVKSEAVVLVKALLSAITQEVNFSISSRSPDIHSFSVNDLQRKGADVHRLFCPCVIIRAADSSVYAWSTNELDREKRRFRNFLQNSTI
jgi:hypothetical protein